MAEYRAPLDDMRFVLNEFTHLVSICNYYEVVVSIGGTLAKRTRNLGILSLHRKRLVKNKLLKGLTVRVYCPILIPSLNRALSPPEGERR